MSIQRDSAMVVCGIVIGAILALMIIALISSFISIARDKNGGPCIEKAVDRKRSKILIRCQDRSMQWVDIPRCAQEMK